MGFGMGVGDIISQKIEKRPIDYQRCAKMAMIGGMGALMMTGLSAGLGGGVSAAKALGGGMMGVGSEATKFPGDANKNNPENWYDGGLDEFRIYNTSLDLSSISRIIDLSVKTTYIKPSSVIEKINGTVFSEYFVEWEPVNFSAGETMYMNETFYFYRAMNAWRDNRK